MENLPHNEPPRNFSRADLGDKLTHAASGLGYFCTLTASRSEGRQVNDQNPRQLCEQVARSLGARGIACIVGHAFAPVNKHGVEVLHVHAFTSGPLPFEFGQGWRRDYGEDSTHCAEVSQTAASAARVARYVANQSGGIAAGIPKGRGHVEVLRAGVLDDVAPLIGAALDDAAQPEPAAAVDRRPDKPADPPTARRDPGQPMPQEAREFLESAGLLKADKGPIDPGFKREVFAALGVAHTFTEDAELQALLWEKLADLRQRDPGQYRRILEQWQRERGPPTSS